MSSNAGDITPLIRHLFDRARQEAHNKSCWLTAAYWVSTLNSMQNEARFNLHSFNRAMTNTQYGFPSCEDVSTTNQTGVFRLKHNKRYFYYLTADDEVFRMPMMNSHWAEEITDFCIKHLMRFNIYVTLE